MLSRGTLLLLVSAIALTGGVLLFENRSGSNPTDIAENADAEASEKLFPFEEEDIESFSVIRRADSAADEAQADEAQADEAQADKDQADEAKIGELSFLKDDEGTWQMTAPESAIAESGAIAFLLSQLTSPTARPVSVEAEDDQSANLEEFDLAEPDYSVSFTAKGNDYILHVGGLDFAGDKRYVQALTIQPETDPVAETAAGTAIETADIYVIPGGIINAVSRPADEWLIADDTSEPEATENDSDADDSATEETNSSGN